MKKFRLLMATMVLVGLILSAFSGFVSASDCGEGSYKDDNWSDQKSEISMAWKDTPGFNCSEGIETVSFKIKAGQYDGAPNSCFSAEWDQNGWRVWENWSSEEEKNEKGCQDISHVIVEWKCACAISTPTATLPVVDETPTATLPVVDETPTATLPVVDETPTATLPVVDETPTATLPVVDETPTATLPVVDKTPTPTITTTPVRVNTGTVMPTAGAGVGGPTSPSTPIGWNWLILSLIGAIGLGGSFIPLKHQET